MTARFLSIRPSLPHVQAERDQSIRQSRQHRAKAKLAKATQAPTHAPTAQGAGKFVEGHVAFTRWFAAFRHQGLLDGLSGHEESAFRALAMQAFTALPLL